MSIASLINRLPGGVAQGLIWGLMALGVYITFRVLKESDLTVDGSFATGGAVAVVLTVKGLPLFVVFPCAFIAGLVCGLCTGLIHTKLKIPAILSGILVQFGLYSINLHIQSSAANVSCNPDKYNVLLSLRNIPKAIIIGLIFAAVLIVVMYWFFGTEIGCAIRATGNNNAMAKAQGINIDNTKLIGFMLGNGLVALSGALMAHYQSFSDVSMGRGAIVIGLAAIIIGEVLSEAIFKKGCSFYLRLFFVVLGGVVYYLIMVLILWLKVDSQDLKLATAIIVMLALAIPNFRKGGKAC